MRNQPNSVFRFSLDVTRLKMLRQHLGGTSPLAETEHAPIPRRAFEAQLYRIDKRSEDLSKAQQRLYDLQEKMMLQLNRMAAMDAKMMLPLNRMAAMDAPVLQRQHTER